MLITWWLLRGVNNSIAINTDLCYDYPAVTVTAGFVTKFDSTKRTNAGK